jgi:hypothetical protein
MRHHIHVGCATAFLLFGGLIKAQQDSITYQNMKVFTIVDGKKTDAYFVKNQKTFTMDGRLIREITFDDSTKHILNYTFYFYNDNKLFTAENHDKNDSIRYIIRHTYYPNGAEKETDRLGWVKGRMKITGKTVFEYDKTGHKIAMKESGSRKKPFVVTHYFYSSGNLVREVSTATKHSDNTIERITEYENEPDGKVRLKRIMERNGMDTVLIQTEISMYDSKGQLKTNEIQDPQGKVMLSKNFEYYGDGNIRNYYEKNDSGKVQLYQTFIIKRHKINLGIQKSYFDKK